MAKFTRGFRRARVFFFLTSRFFLLLLLQLLLLLLLLLLPAPLKPPLLFSDQLELRGVRELKQTMNPQKEHARRLARASSASRLMLGSSRSYASCHSLVEVCVIFRSVFSTAALVLGAPALRGFELCAFRRNPPMIVFSAYS